MKGYITPENSVRAQSRKLRGAVNTLRMLGGYRKIDLLNIINDSLKEKITQADFSKLLGAHNRSDYRTPGNITNFKKVFEIITPILRDQLKHGWDENLKRWIELPKEKYSAQDFQRLQGLIGVWEVISWDKGNSTEFDGYAHIFKLNIITPDEIDCATAQDKFKGNRIIFITSDRLAIELTAARRKVFVILYIGNSELSDIKHFRFAYTDSGTEKIKCGLGIIERAVKKYDEIEPRSIKISLIEKLHNSNHLNFLKNAQLIID